MVQTIYMFTLIIIEYGIVEWRIHNLNTQQEYNVPYLQILTMEWQNIDLRITQFSSYLNSVTCSKPKYQRPVTVFNVDDDGSETLLCCSLWNLE